MSEIKQGDWVRVWGQVLKTGVETGVHPDDTLVEFFSHNAQFKCFIQTDRIESAEKAPKWAEPPCSALTVTGKKGRLVRCIKHHGHAMPHSEAGSGPDTLSWTESATVGYFEAR